MKLSTYLFNLFMTVIILLFMLTAYLYYQVTFRMREHFQNAYDISGITVNGINVDTIDINNIDISGIQLNVPRSTIETILDISDKNATATGDVISNANSQCKLLQAQIDTLSSRLDENRFSGNFNNLRLSYSAIEDLKELMKNMGC